MRLTSKIIGVIAGAGLAATLITSLVYAEEVATNKNGVIIRRSNTASEIARNIMKRLKWVAEQEGTNEEQAMIAKYVTNAYIQQFKTLDKSGKITNVCDLYSELFKAGVEEYPTEERFREAAKKSVGLTWIVKPYDERCLQK